MARKKSNYYTKRLKSLLSLYKHDNLCVVSRLTTGGCEYCQYCLYNMHVTDNGYVCTQDIDVNEVR